MYTGYTRAVGEGEITNFKDMFWHYMYMNRRDVALSSPLVIYTWDEDHETIDIKKRKKELEAVSTRTDDEWVVLWETYCAEQAEANNEMSERRSQGVDRLFHVLRDLKKYRQSEPAVLSPWYDAIQSLLESDIDYNAKDLGFPSPTLEDFIETRTEGAKRDVPAFEENYNRRLNKCNEIAATIKAAVKLFGEPPTGVETKPSSEMW